MLHTLPEKLGKLGNQTTLCQNHYFLSDNCSYSEKFSSCVNTYYRHGCNVFITFWFQVIVHSPIDYPQPINSIYIRPNAWNKLIVTPRLISNSKDLRRWNPTARNCYYPHERSLKFFKIYSLSNCQVECRANKTRDLCGCVSHFDPSMFLNSPALFKF